MNVSIVSKVLKVPPADRKKKYIFVNDNRKICEAIITVGFQAVYICRGGSQDFFTADSFCEYVRDTANTGTAIMEYTFVLSCYYKKANDQIARVLKNNLVEFLTGGYLLFKDKEYLGNYDRQDELEGALDKYVKRFEGGDVSPADPLQFCRLDANGLPKGLFDIGIIRYLMDSKHMFVMGQDLYIYEQGCYFLDNNGVKIKREIQSIIPEQFINYRNLSSLYHLLLDQEELQRDMEEVNQYPAHWINFQNGMFDVKEWALKKHRPEYYAMNQIPHCLDADIRKDMDGNGKETIRFIHGAIPSPEDRVMLWQYLGYCMTRDTCMQKMMFLKGVGGTGKSRVISLFQHIVGTDNFSSMSLANLSERFYPSLLFGKLMNACPDIRSEALMSVENIKKATGEDIMIYEKKGKDPMSFSSYAKLLFSANEIPKNLDEKSDAYYRRLLILEMNVKPAEKILDLDERLAAEAGYSIWMAIGALKKLYEDGEFTESANSRRLVEELHRDADTVKAFMDECTSPKAGSRINRKLIYDKYIEYCQGWGRRELSLRSFYKRLDDMGYQQGQSGGIRFYKNLEFKGDDFCPDGAEEGKTVFGNR